MPKKHIYRSLAKKHAKTISFKKPPETWRRDARRKYRLEVMLIKAGGNVIAAAKTWSRERINVEGLKPTTPETCRKTLMRVVGTKGIQTIRRTVEKKALFKLLEKHGWVQAKAAEEIGVDPTDFIKKIKRLGIKDIVKKNSPRGKMPEDLEILHLLEKTGWNVVKTARILSVERSSLAKYLERAGLKEYINKKKSNARKG